jgi:hypothetical protein
MKLSNQEIINELRGIEASAQLLHERCFMLRQKLEGDQGLPSNSRKGSGISEIQKQKLISDRRKRTMK